MDERKVTKRTDLVTGQSLLARRTAELFGERVMFVPRLGWHTYDGARWTEHEGAAEREVRRFVTEAARDLIRGAAGLDPDEAKAHTSAGIQALRSSAYITGALQFLSEEQDVLRTVSDLDPDPWLLNCANGTLDLRTGDLHAHESADRITKVTRATWNPEAEGATWNWLLNTSLPDVTVRDAFTRCLGGCGLTGSVPEHVLPVMYGRTGTGKSSVIHAVSNALGDYAVTLDPSILIARRSQHPTVLMDLRGSRMAFASETDEGARLATADMKRLTGGDTINAHRMHKDPVEFEPSHLMVMATNHLPAIPDSSDDAVWRRLVVIPFMRKFGAGAGFWDMLEAEADAVLATLVEGCRAYNGSAVGWPESVRVATQDYRDSNDMVSLFLSETYVESTDWSRAHEVYTEWVEWVRWRGDMSLKPGREQDFIEQLRRHGWVVTRNGQRTFVYGLTRRFAASG